MKTLCDVDEELYPERAKKVQDAMGTAPKYEWDMNKVFEDFPFQ